MGAKRSRPSGRWLLLALLVVTFAGQPPRSTAAETRDGGMEYPKPLAARSQQEGRNSDLHFVHCQSTVLVMDFGRDTSKEMRELLVAGTLCEKDLFKYCPPHTVPAGVESRILEGASCKRGDDFSLLVIARATWRAGRLAGVTMHETGDGVDGFSAVLEGDGPCCGSGTSERARSRLYALAWKGRGRPDVCIRRPEQLAERQRAQLERAVLDQNPSFVGTLDSASRICFHHPDRMGFLVVLSSTLRQGEKVLFALVSSGDGHIAVPFVSQAYPESVDTGVVFQHPSDARHGGVFRDSELRVISGIRGDDADAILFVCNTAAILYRVVPAENAAGFQITVDRKEDYGV